MNNRLLTEGSSEMNHRILVVDDEESIRFTFSVFLSDEGYAVETAQNLEEALTKVVASPYSAVFLDILLGRDSGIEVLQVCRENQPNTPVIMVTGAPDRAFKKEL
jgi:DNA-binding NtrC family response regulator